MPSPGLKRAAAAAVGTVSAIGLWELAWWAARRRRRGERYAAAAAEAKRLGRPLVVLGAPDGGVTGGYGCGDITVDLAPTSCPHGVRADITKGLPFASDSVVVFASCVLEYVADAGAALAEIERVSGDHAFFVGVEPWTLTAFAYPGAKRTLPAPLR